MSDWYEESAARRDWDESEDPDDDKAGDEDDTRPCPECGELVYDDADQCPHCGSYITADTSAWADRPLWFIVLGLAGIIAVIIALSQWLLFR